MAITRNFNGASIRKPGAYSKTTVNLVGGFPLSPTGVVAIVGEAAGGEPGSSAGVLRFTSEDLASLISIYKSGPIVDAARILVQPGRDSRVPNGASQILVYKTNASLKASKAFKNAASADLFNISSANYGDNENLISVKIDNGAINVAAKIITVKKQQITEILSENKHEENLQIQYTGTELTATMTIQGGSLVTVAAGDSISVSLAGKTIQDLVDIINADANYTATTTLPSANFKLASDLDPISTATDIKTAVVSLYADQKELLDIIASESDLIEASRIADVEGQVAAVAKTFLSGAALGASTNANFQAGFDALLAVRANIVVPLISRDASALISEGLSDPASTFTIDAVNLQALSHCLTASNTKNRSERNCYVSFKGTFAASQLKARTLNNERASMLFQDVEVRDSSSSLVFLDPWAAACIVAGVQAGTEVGEPPTFKGINVNGIRHQDYNSKTQIDIAIDNGLTPLEERDAGGFRIVVGNTTYNNDANFVFNRISVLEAADYVAYNMRVQLETIFTGNKAKTGTAEAIKNTIISIMSSFLKDDIIVGDDTNNNLGWKDLTVKLIGNNAEIDITITPVQGVDFILSRITLDNIQQSA